jgi:hypothetical protein
MGWFHGVNVTKMLETLQFVGVAEAVARVFLLKKKPMNLCTCDSE